MKQPNGCLASQADPRCSIPRGERCSVCNATSPDDDLVIEIQEIIAEGCACDRYCAKPSKHDNPCGCLEDAMKILKLIREHDGTK